MSLRHSKAAGGRTDRLDPATARASGPSGRFRAFLGVISSSFAFSRSPQTSPVQPEKAGLSRRPTPPVTRPKKDKKLRYSFPRSFVIRQTCLALQEEISVEFSDLFGPPCINRRKLYTIPEVPPSRKPALKLTTMAPTPSPFPRSYPIHSPSPTGQTPSRGVSPVKATRSTERHSSTVSPQVSPTRSSSVAAPRTQAQLQPILRESSPNARAFAVSKAGTPQAQARSRRSKENAEVSAIRRRKHQNNRDDIFSGYHL